MTEQDIQQLKTDAVLWFGPAVTSFDQVYSAKTGEAFVQTDIETNDYIIVFFDPSDDNAERLNRIEFINAQLYQNTKTILCIGSYEGQNDVINETMMHFDTLNDLFDYVADAYEKAQNT